MNAERRRDELNQITERIIGCAYRVSQGLGCGFLEKVYENAMMIELLSSGLAAEQQKRIDVYYRGELVGEYCADIVVNNVIFVELKAAEAIVPEHEAQIISYLKGTGMELGLLINFGPKPTFIRRILTNDRKNIRLSS